MISYPVDRTNVGLWIDSGQLDDQHRGFQDAVARLGPMQLEESANENG